MLLTTKGTCQAGKGMGWDGYRNETIALVERPRDPEIDAAKKTLRAFFVEHPREVFYLTQVAVLLEKRHFHWITDIALHELIGEGFLNSEVMPLLGKTRVRFVTHYTNRYFRRAAKRKLAVVRAFSEPTIARACGHQAEILFVNAFAERGFAVHGHDINQFRGRKWTRTGHNIDFIMERDRVVYGCEVKNTWGYIDREELTIKLDLCGVLGVKPVFIMRFAPKSYLWENINPRGGFWVIYETQVYPLGQEPLVHRIREDLGLNVDAPRRIPDSIIDRFMKNVHRRLAP